MKNNFDTQNKIVLAIAGVVIIAIVIFALVSGGGGSSSGADQNAASSSNRYEGELTLDQLSAYSGCPLTADKDAFAQCLTQKGWVMYGAYWCPHCADQKGMFGTSSFQYVHYVECADPNNGGNQTAFCTQKGIKGYPTWIFEGTSTAATSSATSTS